MMALWRVCTQGWWSCEKETEGKRKEEAAVAAGGGEWRRQPGRGVDRAIAEGMEAIGEGIGRWREVEAGVSNAAVR